MYTYQVIWLIRMLQPLYKYILQPCSCTSRSFCIYNIQHLKDYLDLEQSALKYMMKCYPEEKEEEQMRRSLGRYGLTGKQQVRFLRNSTHCIPSSSFPRYRTKDLLVTTDGWQKALSTGIVLFQISKYLY